jgi:hypothetical protein
MFPEYMCIYINAFNLYVFLGKVEKMVSSGKLKYQSYHLNIEYL